ncbi:ice-binding family protein [Streptosporangium sp. NPDC000509]|uniref:ice-binding family protein n=1 Tax=Streptosporangium sp. NPDC000509 TaxID=3366186 RepID=UPI003693C147
MTRIGHSRIVARTTVHSWLTGALTVAVALGCVAAAPHTAHAANTTRQTDPVHMTTTATTATAGHPAPETPRTPDTPETPETPEGDAIAPVSLGTATNFAILAGRTVTNTGSGVVTGELGVSPGSVTTGFPPGVMAGAVYTADPVAAQAQTDLATAYRNVVGLRGTASLPAQLGGTTVKPGVYNSVSGAFQLTGEVTLDGQGNPNALFVLRAPGLITAPASTVTLVNGAQACNVFWQVGGSATLGAGSVFAGNILALTSITAADGTTVNGRLLAREGSVSVDDTTVTRSACTVVPPRKTSTKLAAFCDPEAPGHLTLVASVTSSGPVPPAGPVEFFANGVSQDRTQSDATGRATLIVSQIPPRTHEFVAAFAGTNRLDPSSSPVLTVVVGPKGVCPASTVSPTSTVGPLSAGGTGGTGNAGDAGDAGDARDDKKRNRSTITYPPRKKMFKAKNRERNRHPRSGHHRHQR